MKLSLSWTWNHGHTRLDQVRVGRLPKGAVIRFACRGAGCNHHPEVAGRRRLRQFERAIRRRHFRAGDRIFITISRPGYAPERAEIVIRDGTVPAVRLL